MANTVLISNLPASLSASDLEDMFTSVGDVITASIAGMGRGFVEMGNAEDVQNCVRHFDGQIKDGQTLVAREFKPVLPARPRALASVKRQMSARGAK